MKKSLFSEDYKLFLNLLREVRERSGFTQEQIAKHLETTHLLSVNVNEENGDLTLLS